MDIQTTQKGKDIGNVGVLDARKATEGSIGNIRRIGNVGVLVYSSETSALVTRLNVGNVGASVEMPVDAKFANGEVSFSRSTFQGLDSPINLLVNGELFVHPDVPEGEIRKGLGRLAVNGRVICPEHLAGAIQEKLFYLTGVMVTFPASANAQVITGQLTLDENRLSGLADGSELIVVGNLRMPQVLPDDLLSRKLASLNVTGKLKCREENLGVIMSRLVNKSTKISSVPKGYLLVDRELSLDNAALGSLPSRRLYCTGRVVVQNDIDAADLDRNIESLIVEDVLLCPNSLRSTIATKCDLLSTRSIFYEGELWLVESEMELTAERFEFLEGKATIVVEGELTVDPAVDARLLAQRLARVHNFGEIRGTSAQLAAIQSRLGTNEGELQDTARVQVQEGMSNLGILTL